MKRVNQYQFYQMGMFMHPLSQLAEGAAVQQVAWQLYVARNWIDWLLSQTTFSLIVSRSAALRLREAIGAVVPENITDFGSIDPKKVLDWSEHWAITDSLKDLETLLAAELPTFDTYIVSKKGIYSTADLVERAENAIDDSARAVVSQEALRDFNQAGRCLAFELPTAAGFHTMRSVEAVLRTYWALVVKPILGTKPPEMAVCINELRSQGEDPKLMDVLDHIRDLHRNTIMHPEAFLETNHALRLFDIAKSAISAMGDRILALSAAPPQVPSASAAHV